jgi:uncharacterized protein involved in type VI secretion and phage assembly
VCELNDATPGRVRVKFPHLGDKESGWCPVVSPMGGGGRGLVFLPEVGDQVMLAFEHGDTEHGFVLGAIWTTKQAPPPLDGKPAENNLRLIRSRCGHTVLLDDTKGKERVEVRDKDGRRVVLDAGKKKVQVVCDDGDIEVTAGKGNVTVHADSGSATLKAKTVTIEATGDLTLKAGGSMTLNGSKISLN